MTRTGCPARPPRVLTSATQARMAAGAGPEMVPRGPASTPKEPKTISLRFTAPWGWAGPAAPAAPPPGVAPDPPAPALPAAAPPDGPVAPLAPAGLPPAAAAATFEGSADPPRRPAPPLTAPAT